MKYKRLFIWVEGNDDERFFRNIIKPIFTEKYDLVEVRSYAKLKTEKVNQFLKSIKAMKSDYIFVGDVNSELCVTLRKQIMLDQYENMDENRIIVIVKEIESWYLAGLTDTNSKKLKVSPLRITDEIDKEQFNKLIPNKFDSRIDFMLEILKCFSLETAKRKNKSFGYFCEKYELQAFKSIL